MFSKRRNQYIQNGKNEILARIKETFSFKDMIDFFTNNNKKDYYFDVKLNANDHPKYLEFYEDMIQSALKEWKSEFAETYFHGNLRETKLAEQATFEMEKSFTFYVTKSNFMIRMWNWNSNMIRVNIRFV